MRWGWGENPLINVRGEEIMFKMMFRPFLFKRCVIMLEGCFEFDKNREPYKYINDDGSIVYLAGIFNRENECLILTNEAKSNLFKIHSRMPMVLAKDEIDEYLDPKIDPNIAFNNILNKHHSKWNNLKAIRVVRRVNYQKNKCKLNIMTKIEYRKYMVESKQGVTSFFSRASDSEKERSEKAMKAVHKTQKGLKGLNIDSKLEKSKKNKSENLNKFGQKIVKSKDTMTDDEYQRALEIQAKRLKSLTLKN